MAEHNRKALLLFGNSDEDHARVLSRQATPDYEVTVVQGLEEGFQNLVSNPIDVAVVVQMDPIANIIDVLERLLKELPGLPVVVITKAIDEAEIAQILRSGAKEVVRSVGLKKNGLLSAMGRAIERGESSWQQYRNLVQESEARYRALFNQATDSVLLLEPTEQQELLILDANDAALKLYGYGYDELVGKPVAILVGDDSKHTFDALMRRVFVGAASPVEMNHKKHDGRNFPVEVSVRSLEFGGKQIVQAIYKDITDRKRAEDERARFEDQLRQSQKMEAVGTLAGGLAHDMNNVLGAIMAVASVIRAENAQQNGDSQDLDEILGACQRGRELTKNLLSFARKEPPQLRRFAINDVIREVESLLKHTFPKQVEVLLDLEKNLPPLDGDPGQINHALINICINSAHAMGGVGRLVVQTKSGEIKGDNRTTLLGLKPGPYVVLQIKDSGVGMDAHSLEHAFEPFFTTKAPGEGTGLGLAMVYSTVKNHGGMVSLESRVGEGTTVTLHLPAIERVVELEMPDSDAPLAPELTEGLVLLIDDERMVRSAGERVLKSLGYNVLTAANGEEGVDVYKKHGSQISLVVLDLLMPVKNGEETFKEILKMDPGAKILITSGYAHALEVNKLLDAGALGFLEKPFDRRALNSAIIRMMQKSR